MHKNETRENYFAEECKKVKKGKTAQNPLSGLILLLQNSSHITRQNGLELSKKVGAFLTAVFREWLGAEQG